MKPTPWFFAMSCIRVCRGCFHKPNSPVELCTLAFAKKESRLSQQETKVLAKIVLEKRKRVGLADSTQPCTLVLRSSARALARARQRPLTPESWQTSSSPSSSSAESYSSPSSSPTEPRPITASKAASPGQRSTLLTRHFRSVWALFCSHFPLPLPSRPFNFSSLFCPALLLPFPVAAPSQSLGRRGERARLLQAARVTHPRWPWSRRCGRTRQVPAP